jgi:hypothetical protein
MVLHMDMLNQRGDKMLIEDLKLDLGGTIEIGILPERASGRGSKLGSVSSTKPGTSSIRPPGPVGAVTAMFSRTCLSMFA